ncbi:MAG TPA: GrpB family protein [Burkholderiaceae bacterium]|nr:GrpB family protein [Burkholderiaceae bacterium]
MFAMIELTDADVDVRRPVHREPMPEVGILAYQAGWDAGFRAQADVLGEAFAPLSPHIEHVGTTAIAGTAARPIIDVLMGVVQPPAVEVLIEGLYIHGYRRSLNMQGSPGEGPLLVRWQQGLPTHHVHVVEYLGPAWRQMILFRDVLRLDARLAREYEWLRRRFAGLHPANQVAYVRAKATFIQSIVGQAR